MKGKGYPCRITMGAMVRFKRATGRDVSQMNTGDITDLARFLYCCIQSACKADDIAFDIAFDDFIDLIEPTALQNFYADMTPAPDADAEKKTNRQTSTD